MKKILLLLLIVILGAAGFLGYNHYFGWTNLTRWSFISDEIPLVYEYEPTTTIRSELENQKVWKSFSSLEPIANLKENITSLDSVVENNAIVGNLLSNNTILLGITPVSKTKLDFLIVFDLKNIDQFDAIGRIINKKYSVKSRKYEGFVISDIFNADNERKFTYIFYKNFFIGSQTPFLVEDAIRTITNTESKNFLETQEPLFQLAKLQNDVGNIYINAKKLSGLADVITERSFDVEKINRITSSIFLDARITGDHILLNGFSINKKDDFLSVFDNNIGKPMTQLGYIPNSAYTVTHLSFENPKKYLGDIKDWVKKNEIALSQQIQNTESKYDLDFLSFGEWLGNESCVYSTESADLASPNQVGVISLRNPELARQQLYDLDKRIMNVTGDSSFNEEYSSLKITHLPINEFPSSFLGPTFNGFETSYFTILDGQLVLSNDLQSVKDLIDQIGNENIWSKSLKANNFMDICNKESNLSYFLKVPVGWRSIQNKIDPLWRESIEKQSSLIKSFEFSALQFSNVDNKYFTNLALYHPGDFEPKNTGKTLKPVASLELAYPLITKPYIVRNHNDGSMELLVQDSTNTLYLLNNNFEVIWDDSIGSAITTNISQVDYYKNKKLQYAFGAGDKIHLVDRKGNPVEQYPTTLGESEINSMEIIDYNNSKNYRWSVTNSSNRFFLTDKEAKPLKGWDPYPNKYEGQNSIKHFRIRGKDIFVITEEQGKVNLLSRSGTAYKGFPILFQEKIDENYVITASSNFGRSILTMITKSGELMKYNLLGQLQYKEQLVKESGSSTFSILKDKNSIKYLILRQDDNKVAILENNGNERFSKSYLSDVPIKAQYYDFGPGQELIILRDPQQEYAYLYNGKGDLLNTLPIETSEDLSVLYFQSEGLFKIYKVYENEVALYEISN